MRAVFAIAVLSSVGMLALGAWPGQFEEVVFGFPLFAISVPLLGAWFLLLLGLAFRDVLRRRDSLLDRRWWGVRSLAITFGALALLWLQVPQRSILAIYRSEFEELAGTIPAGKFRCERLGASVGPYYVDFYGVEETGAVFLRTGVGADGIGPDQISYGFAFRPNGKTCPFGLTRYQQVHLLGDWYAFSVSDD